jgi:hypothetical protein
MIKDMLETEESANLKQALKECGYSEKVADIILKEYQK